jgi:hypothetical protein
MHRGRLAACGAPEALKGGASLEEAYLALTGENMEETAEPEVAGAAKVFR